MAVSDPIMQALDEMQARCTAATFDGDWLDLYGPPTQLRAIHAVTESDMPRLIAALRAVLEDHYPARWTGGTVVVCSECSWLADARVLYPCSTVKAIAETLEVNDE